MHRWLLAALGVAAAACASAPRGEATGAPAARSPARPLVIAGFEKQPGESVLAVDLARDGKPDAWTYSIRDPDRGEVPLRTEKDLNADGRVDTWERYGPEGEVERLAHDLDFDGGPDVTLFYERGQLVRKELASGSGGMPRTISHYEQGKLVRKERDQK